MRLSNKYFTAFLHLLHAINWLAIKTVNYATDAAKGSLTVDWQFECARLLILYTIKLETACMNRSILGIDMTFITFGLYCKSDSRRVNETWDIADQVEPNSDK